MVTKRKNQSFASKYGSPAPHNESCKVVRDPDWLQARAVAIQGHTQRVQKELRRLARKQY